MKIGAASLVRAWGIEMSLSRDGSVLVSSFKGRLLYNAPSIADTDTLDGSLGQFNLMVIAPFEDFAGVVPRKFDEITATADGQLYTVQWCRPAGADEYELYKMLVRGGQT